MKHLLMKLWPDVGFERRSMPVTIQAQCTL